MLVYAVAGGNEGASLFIPPIGELIFSAIIVSLIGFVIARYALPKYNAIVDERARSIQEGIEATEKAKREAANAEASAAQVIGAAQREAAKIRDIAHEDGKEIVADARAKAKNEADRIVEAAQRQISADVQAAQIALRSDIGRLATNLADTIVGEHLQDEALSSRVIDRFLDEMEKQTAESALTQERRS